MMHAGEMLRSLQGSMHIALGLAGVIVGMALWVWLNKDR